MRLFDRTANKLVLNANGRIFLRAVETADKVLADAKTELLDRAAVPSGEIRLLILTNRSIVTDSIAAFKQDYPAVTFHVRHEIPQRDAYRSFDILITDREIDTDEFDRRTFIDEELRLAVHHSNPLAQHTSVSLQELQNEPFICMQKGSSLRDCMDSLFRQAAITPHIAIECDDPQYIRKYMQMGLGVTLFPLVSWHTQIDDTFRLLPIDGGIRRRSRLYIRRGALQVAARFADTLERRARTLHV